MITVWETSLLKLNECWTTNHLILNQYWNSSHLKKLKDFTEFVVSQIHRKYIRSLLIDHIFYLQNVIGWNYK